MATLNTSNQTITSAGSPVHMNLVAFDDSMTAAKALLPGVTLPTLDVSAEASIFIKTSWIREVFTFSADIDAENESSLQNMVFHTNAYSGSSVWDTDSSSQTINPAHARMNAGTYDYTGDQPSNAGHYSTGGISLAGVTASDISSSKFMVKHDFARHIAKELFNIPLTDIFYNLDAVLASIELGGLDAWEVIKAALNTAYNNGDGLGEDNDLSSNIGFQLFQQMTRVNPYRLQADGNDNTISTSASVLNGSTQQAIPFVEGDIISFKFTVASNSNQRDILVGTNNASNPSESGAVPTRTYLIKLCIVDDPTTSAHENIRPTDTYKANVADSGTGTDLATAASSSEWNNGTNTHPDTNYQATGMYTF